MMEQGATRGGKARKRQTRRPVRAGQLRATGAGTGALALGPSGQHLTTPSVPVAQPAHLAVTPDSPTADDAPSAPPAPSAPAAETPAASTGALFRALLASLVRDARERTRRISREGWLWLGVLALATILRFWGLGDKPLHHDESMHAYFSLAFARDPASYSYNPLLHGPFQFHAEGLMFAMIIALEHLFGQAQAWGDPWINDTTARIVPALFGVGIVALPYWLRRELGRVGALIAAFLLAVSPAFVYFSRFLREDIYFNFFMFAMVVAAVRFAEKRTLRWFVALLAATVLAYATFEGIYLTLVIFLSFLVLLAVWELAHGIARLLPDALTDREKIFFSRSGLLLLLGAVAAAVALVGLHTLNTLSAYINAHQTQSQTQVQQLEDTSVTVLLYGSIVLALVVIGTLLWQMFRDDVAYAGGLAPGEEFGDDGELSPAARRAQLVERVDWAFTAPGRWKARLRERLHPEHQRFLRLVLGISWVQWFVAFVTGWMIFAALYWIFPGDGRTLGQGFQQGIGSGIWQGLYYWLEQQHVARGGQPWYYYLLLIPLYEQLAVVFGLAGAVYTFFRPTRFRLFLVWWFALSLGLYSWAGEKMPWLSIHILLPLMLLAAVSLAALVAACVRVAGELMAQGRALLRAAPVRTLAPVAGIVAALALLVPMVHSMLILSHQDAANGPLEMMVYVQTTPDVQRIMDRIAYADKVLYGGKHQIHIVVGPGEEWPFYWYLRDYPNTIYDSYNAADPKSPQEDVLILLPAGDPNHNDGQSFMAAHPTGYQMKEYKLRSWWDEAYKPPPCIPTKQQACPPSADWGSGVGVGAYLSYGSTPPPGAKFNLGLASQRLWNWLWFRQPLGFTGGSYDFVFIVRNGLPIHA
jgi:predicted membrane-bound mannosyltransferase